jgi:hypothetical protein
MPRVVVSDDKGVVLDSYQIDEADDIPSVVGEVESELTSYFRRKKLLRCRCTLSRPCEKHAGQAEDAWDARRER